MEGEDAADELKSGWELLVVAADEVGLSAADDLVVVNKEVIIVVLLQADAVQQRALHLTLVHDVLP